MAGATARRRTANVLSPIVIQKLTTRGSTFDASTGFFRHERRRVRLSSAIGPALLPILGQAIELGDRIAGDVARQMRMAHSSLRWLRARANL